MANKVSVDGGATKHTAESIGETELDSNWDALNAAMDPDLRLTVGGIVWDDYPNDKRRFLSEYLERATQDLVVG